MTKKILSLFSVLLLLSLTAAQCGAPAEPEKVVETVVVEKEVEVEVEKEVVVTKEVEVVKEVVVTPTPASPAFVRAWTIGPGPVPVTRATNLEDAAKRLGGKINLDVQFSELKWGPFMEEFYTACEVKAGPHIVTSKDIAVLAEGGFLVPLDEYVKEGQDKGYGDIYDSLWNAARYTPQEGPYAGEEHIWGIPQDATPNGVWFRKDVLRELGYSDEQIAEMLPTSAENITFDDLAKLGKEAKDAGLVEWGILHRPSAGDTVMLYMNSFGGQVYDAEANTLVLNKKAAQGMFEWFAAQVEAGVIPPAPPEWSITHGTFVGGQTLFTFASHVGTPSEWMQKYDMSEETFTNDLGFILFPAMVSDAKPSATLGPLAYLVTQGCVPPEEENPDAAAALLLEASSPDLVARHTVQTLRPPIRKAALDTTQLKHYTYADYMRNAAPMLASAQDVPNHPSWGTYKSHVFEILKAVEADLISPADAVEELVTFLQTDIPDIVVE
jgi:inositol-phosphate transport system substrate-binding protein